MTRLRDILALILLGLVVAGGLTACSGEDKIRQEEVPINFASETAETEVVTRANTNLGHDFVVYGYKTVNSATQQVFKGYTVTYSASSAGTSESNTHNYEYVHGNQTIKYWDFGASEYNFWGYTGDKSHFTDDGTTLTLTISDVEQSVKEPNVTERMFSALYHRSSVSTDVVKLLFKRPYTKVRVMFYTNTKLTNNAFDNIQISGITFGPESPNKIIKGGSLKVTYPKRGVKPETYSTTTTASAESLSFKDVQLDHTQGTASNNAVTAKPTDDSEFYYVVPNDYTTPFTLSANIDGEDKTAVVPANFMNWRPNFVYTYIFKISGGKYMELYDVQIDPWKYGGSQEEVWNNW